MIFLISILLWIVPFFWKNFVHKKGTFKFLDFWIWYVFSKYWQNILPLFQKSWLKNNHLYRKVNLYYRIFHPLTTTGLAPFLFLIVLNVRICIGLKRLRQSQERRNAQNNLSGTAKRKLERLQFSTSSFFKIWSEFKAYFWNFWALYHLLFDLETIGVN